MGYEAITGPNWIVPTPPAGDSSNRVADTAFVAAAVAAGPSGSVLQTQYADFTTLINSSSNMAGGIDTVPVKTDGTSILNVTITPFSASNTLLIQALVPISCDNQNMWVALFQDAATSAIAATGFGNAPGQAIPAGLLFQTVAATTGPTTFKIRAGNFATVALSWTLNGNVGVRRLGGTLRAAITVQETKV